MSDSFRICAIIPCYNHSRRLREVIVPLRAQDLFVIVIDDGSSESEREAIVRIANDFQKVLLHRLPVNQGRGFAIQCGFRLAEERGFTHALQIDADAQHDIRDIPIFIAAARANPHALIAAYPVYDESVPFHRKHGRKITTALVYVETLSFALKDALCGFRIYPLEETLRLAQERHLPARMNFDVDIAVRLIWRRVPVVNIPTRVIYREDNTSNFRMVRDNVSMIVTHLKLLCEMVPQWIACPSRPNADAKDSLWFLHRERGWGVVIDVGFFLFRSLGRRISLFVLYFIVAYFFLTGRKARRASREYLRRIVMDSRSSLFGRPASFALSFRHFLEFGRAAVDKLAVWNGDITLQDVTWENLEELRALVASGSGGLVIGAHMGNIEVARSVARDVPGLRISALMFLRQAQQFARMLSRVNPRVEEGLIAIDELSPETAIRLREEIQTGTLIGVLGDRVAAGSPDRVRSVKFLGSPALFPEGPWILAHLLEMPVFLLFCFRESGTSYRVVLEKFTDRVILERARRTNALDEVMQKYAERLEAQCLEYPLQWYNFFDFWTSSPALRR